MCCWSEFESHASALCMVQAHACPLTESDPHASAPCLVQAHACLLTESDPHVSAPLGGGLYKPMHVCKSSPIPWGFAQAYA